MFNTVQFDPVGLVVAASSCVVCLKILGVVCVLRRVSCLVYLFYCVLLVKGARNKG